MSSTPDKGWFRRRKCGIGWALHRSWQGWLLIVADVALAEAGVAWFEPKSRARSVYLGVLVALSLLLCWWKGDRSLWRGDALPAKDAPATDSGR